MVDPRTAQNLRQWENKPSLRAVYQDLYRKMAGECLPGATLEIGGGSRNFKRYRNDVVTSDVVCAPWLDLVADAEALPFKGGVFSNIVCSMCYTTSSFHERFSPRPSGCLFPEERW